MAEIKNVGAQPLPVEQGAKKIADEAGRLPNQTAGGAGETAVGRGTVGQPIGLPNAEPTTQNALMPDVVTGRDATQLISAEKMRSNAGGSATDVLLGLDRQPSASGGLLAPPGNLDALRHLTPQMRRTVLRNLLAKQRGQMRSLVAVMRDEKQEQQENQPDGEQENESENFLPVPVTAASFYNRRAVEDLQATTRMLDLLDEMLGMQDYTLSQMGTFAQG